MKLTDKFRLAGHSIKNNPARSTLTSLIVVILGFLIMGLFFIGITFSKNMYAVYVQLVKESNVKINYKQDGYIDDIEMLFQLADRYTDVIVNIQSDSGSVQIMDFSHFKEINIKILIGQKPHNYTGQNYVYLSSESEEDYQIGGIYSTNDASYIIAGFYNSDSYYKPIVDMSYYHNHVKPLFSFSITYIYSEGRNFRGDMQELKKFFEEVRSVYGSNENARTYSYDFQELNNIKLISTLIIGTIAFIAIILILMSIGSVSNSIMISVDQNQKYLGLMKALGLKNKGIKDLVIIETFLTVVVGIVVASLALVASVPLIEKLNLFLLEYLLKDDYYSVFDSFPFEVVLPVYLPILTIIAFTLLAFLFSKSSISKIAKSNPIEIMNEVN